MLTNLRSLAASSCLVVSLLLAGCSGSGSGGGGSTPAPQPAAAPTVATIAPAVVTAGAATTTVTVNGSGFTSATVVQVNSVAEATTYVSATQVTAVVPAAQLASGVLLPVTAVNGAMASGAVNLEVDNPSPVITQFSPAFVAVGSGPVTVMVTGTGFVPSTTIQVAGSARPTTFVSSTQVSASLTAADFGTGSALAITAVNGGPGGGTSVAGALPVNNAMPAITQLAPATVLVGATPPTLTVTGSGFVATTVLRVNGAARATTVSSATQLTTPLTAADVATAGTLTITALTPAPGGGASAALIVTVTNPVPAITQLTPATLALGASASTVTVTGTGFVPATVINVGGAARTTTYVSASQVTVTLTAADLAQSGSVSLIAVNPAPGGGSSAAASVAVNYALPTITSFSPASLTTGAATNTTVTVNGTNFTPQTNVIVQTTYRPATYVSSTQIMFIATVQDQQVPGNLPIAAYNPFPGGTSARVNLPVSGATATPVISSVSPNSVIAGTQGVNLFIYATGLTNNSTVQWNGTTLPGSVYYQYYYQGAALSVSVPANLLATAGTASITVTTPTSTVAVSNAFSFAITNPPVPTLTGLNPGYGAINTPVTVSVSGTGFTGNTTLSLNGVNVPVSAVTPTSLTAMIPASALTVPGNLSVAVTTPAPGGGTSASLPFTTYVGLVNNSMIYNPANGLFYLSVPSSAGAPYGNSVVPVDPATGALGTPIYVGSEPNKLAITADGKFLWVGLDGASAVRKVDLTANTAGLQFNLVPGSAGSSPGTAAALAALPGATDSVVVSSSANGYYSINIAIYDGGVARANPSSTSTYYNAAYALAVNSTVGEVYAGAGSTYYVFTYSSTGLTLKKTATNGNYATSSPYDEFQIAGGVLYTDYGKAYDPEAGTLQGTFYSSGSTVAQGPATADTTLGKVFVMDNGSGSYYATNQIQVFNTADYNQTSSAVIPISIPSSTGSPNYTQLSPSRLTRWGTNGLAFRQANGFYPLRSNLVKDLSTTQADLGVTLASAGSTTGASTTYTATVTNTGPAAATNVALLGMPPGTGILVSATPSAGSCSIAGTIACDLGGLAVNATATVTVLVTQTSAGSATFTAQVSGSETDSSLGNNQATITTTITGSAYNPQPVIGAIAPASVIAGSTDTLISVTGANFSSGSAILVGGTALSTNYVSATRLTATIPSSQLTTLGWLPVTVSSPAPGGGVSAALPFSIYSIVNLTANRMLFDPYTRKIMASVASTATTVTGNSLVALTPDTGTLGTAVPIGSQPSNLALTEDGQILYVSLLGSNSVARFNMLTQAADFTVPIPSPAGYTIYIPGAIAPVPGTENSIALSTGYGGVGLYDFNTTARTATARSMFTSGFGATCLGFSDATHLLASSTYNGFTSFALTSTGFGAGTSTSLGNFNGCFQIANGLAFSAGGGVANLATSPITQAGDFVTGSTYYYANAFTAADPSLQRSFFLANSPNSSNLDGVSIYDQNTFLLNSVVSLNIAAHETAYNYSALDFLRWGQDGLAILTSGGHIYLVRGGAVVPRLLTTNTASVLTGSSTSTVTHGAGNLMLTLTGSNFVPGVAVSWNGGYRTTTIVDATHVTVAIPAADLAAAGSGSLVATNPGAPVSAALTVTIN